MFEYTFMQNAFIVSLLISLLCPLIGIFLVLRRYSMIGDALSHASLAGVAMGLLLKSTPIMGCLLYTSQADGIPEDTMSVCAPMV